MTAINDVTTLEKEGGIAVVTLNSPPVNALSAPVREGITNGIKQAIDDPDVKAIVLICEGKTFIAGADITEFGKAPKGPSLFDAQAMIENAPKPVVAAIHGTALGGGCEIALPNKPMQRTGLRPAADRRGDVRVVEEIPPGRPRVDRDA